MNKIQEFRKLRGLSQAELAEKAGISEISIRKYEKGERRPKVETLSKIAMVLNVPITDLAGFEPSMLSDFAVPPGKIKLGSEGEEILVDPIEFQRVFNGVVQKCCPNPVSRLVDKFYHLNAKGQNKALEQINLLTKIPEYQEKNIQKQPPLTLGDLENSYNISLTAAHSKPED